MAEPKSVLITGTSSGLGLSTAVTLAGQGWSVFATMRNPARREELDAAVHQAGVDPRLVQVLRLDVTEPTSIRSALDQIAAKTGGRLDALVNNAGLNTEACFEDIDMAEVRNLFDTVVLGAMELTRGALPLLRKARDPRLMFMSSFAAVTGGPTMTIYAAAKAAIERFAEALAWEVAADGIRVAVVRPGFHRSNIFSANSGRVRPSDSRYRVLYDRIDPLAQKAIDRARDPVNVANKVAEILGSRHPGFRYSVGWDAHLVAASNPFIPQRLRHRIARLLFRPGLRGAC
jgi:NAD(P)-dependent dehydrogenase (short-subunit alcohol dehydrogenase family)